MARRLFVVVGILFFSVHVDPAARAQATDHLRGAVARRVYEGPPLSLTAAIDEALERNPSLIALRRQFDAARQRPARERFLMPPSFEAQIWQWPVATLNPLNTNMYMFTAQQELPGRGKRALRAALAEKDVELASAEIAVGARDVINDVTRAYADLAVARRAIDIHLASVDLLRQFADVSTIKYAAGRSPQQDVLKAVVELSRLHEDLVTHEESAATAAARLNTLLDREPHAPIGPLAEPREDVVLLASEELQRLALERQPALRVAQLGVERAEAALAVVHREYKPDFFVGGGYMVMPREAGAWTAKVGMTWPNAPWSRGRLDAQKAEAAAEVDATAAHVRAVERQLRLYVHEAYIRVTAATQRAALLRTTLLPQSEQTLELSRVAYQTDRVDFLALIDNQRALLDAQLSYYRALSDRELALADLARAVGTDILASPPVPSTNEVN
ncbi:MAG: TolC family protein [Vicinamibacterales bacterium]